MGAILGLLALDRENALLLAVPILVWIAVQGFTLANLGRLKEAMTCFERAVALKPDDEGARRNLEMARKMLR